VIHFACEGIERRQTGTDDDEDRPAPRNATRCTHLRYSWSLIPDVGFVEMSFQGFIDGREPTSGASAMLETCNGLFHSILHRPNHPRMHTGYKPACSDPHEY
jgi:hypothetical protein